MAGTLTDRGLLRAVLVAFALLLAYRFLAAVVLIRELRFRRLKTGGSGSPS